MIINIKCRYCGVWYQGDTNSLEATMQCCSKEHADEYFQITGSGFNFYNRRIKLIQKEIAAHKLVAMHHKGGSKRLNVL